MLGSMKRTGKYTHGSDDRLGLRERTNGIVFFVGDYLFSVFVDIAEFAFDFLNFIVGYDFGNFIFIESDDLRSFLPRW